MPTRLATTPIQTAVDAALREDEVEHDLTTGIFLEAPCPARATIVANEPLTVAGLVMVRAVFRRVDPRMKVTMSTRDGTTVRAHTVLCRITGDLRALLRAERVALNFLQHLSGIASLTHACCHAVRGTSARILDTRKTTPGLRHLQKWAVTMGGGHNHRMSLSDGVLIKDNHIVRLANAGTSLAEACRLARARAPRRTTICIETDTLAQVRDAMQGGPDIILLDNMSPPMIRRAVAMIDRRALVEVSGGVTLRNLRSRAVPGVDRISIGALTHSAPAKDISLVIEHAGNRTRETRKRTLCR